MKINVTNLEKLEAAFTLANGKCTARLAHRWDAEAYVTIIENKLTNLGIPKCMWSGMKFSVQPRAEVLPNSYYKRGFNPEATSFKLERGANAWFVVDIKRTSLLSHKVILLGKFTGEQESAVLANAYKF